MARLETRSDGCYDVRMRRQRQTLPLLGFAALLAACAAADSEPTDRAAASRPSATTEASAEAVVERPVDTEPATVSAIETEYRWQPVPIGAGGYVTGIVAGGTDAGEATWYARTDVGGAFAWNEVDGTWHQIVTAEGLQDVEPVAGDYSVASIAAAPSDGEIVYLAVGDDFNPDPPDADVVGTGRILRSDDGGRTWTTSEHRWFVNGNQQYRVGTERLAVDPRDPDHVVFATQREGLWRSFNGGRSWDQVPLDRLPSGLNDDGRGDQAGVNFAVYAATDSGALRLFAGVAQSGMYVSDDDGETWEQVVDLAGGEVPASPVITPGSLLFATHTPAAPAARLLRIDVETSSVEELALPAPAIAWHVAADPTDPASLVLADDAVRDGHLWTSADGGNTWSAHDIEVDSPEIPWLEATDLDLYMSTGRLMYDPVVPGRVWFAEGMGVWRTDDIEAPTVTWRSTAAPPGGR